MASSLRRRAFLIGGHITKFIGKGNPAFITKRHADFGKKENPAIEWYLSEAVGETLKATGTPAKLVDSIYVGNFAGELFCNQGHMGAGAVASHSELRHKPSMRVEAACASGGVAFASAVRDIQAGRDVVLACGAEVQNTVSARQGAAYLATASHFAKQRSLDEFTFPAMFARRMKAYEAEYGVSLDELAPIVVKAYGNANLNPLAHMHHVKMSLEHASQPSDKNPLFLSNPALKPYLKVSDCSQVTDGGAGLVVVSEDGLKMMGKTPADAVEVLTVAHTTDDLYDEGNHFRMDNTREAARQAYESTGLAAKDMQVAEVHDCFAIAEVLMTEALGFAHVGKGVELAASGATARDGKIPVNTGGGLIAFGHAVGASGIREILDVFNQMKGNCGDFQLAKTPEFGVSANMGGSDKTTVVSILKNI